MASNGGGAARHAVLFERCNIAIAFAHFRRCGRGAATSVEAGRENEKSRIIPQRSSTGSGNTRREHARDGQSISSGV
jgi:hypothetical protein